MASQLHKSMLIRRDSLLPEKRMRSAAWICIAIALLSFFQCNQAPAEEPLILVHYMPWFSADPPKKQWGWHWTMDHFDPNIKEPDGRRQIASRYYPQIGPYDSGDPHVIEYHTLLMKIAGIDGVIIDWYGLTDLFDYRQLHNNTQQMIACCENVGLRFAICYEDQTVRQLIKAKRIATLQATSHATKEINWLAEHWFPRPGYLRLDEKPVLLSFGHAGLSDRQWEQCIEDLAEPIAYFSEHHRRKIAVGAFDWPIPIRGISAQKSFLQEAKVWKTALPVAFPRFVDVYRDAKVNEEYGTIADASGRTFEQTLEMALTSKYPWIQIATWNDWGEGTQIEPSAEFAYRDLERLMVVRQSKLDRIGSYRPEDLRLPIKLFRLRQSGRVAETTLDAIANNIVTGNTEAARDELDRLSRPAPSETPE